MRLYGGIEERLLARLRFTDRCWVWGGYRNADGYGKVRIGGRTKYVHRAVVEWASGVKLGMNDHVDHLCRNRGCSRPSHLEVVTARENTRRGAKAKVTVWQVIEMRRLRRSGWMVKLLADKYGIHRTEVSKICNGHRFKNLH